MRPKYLGLCLIVLFEGFWPQRSAYAQVPETPKAESSDIVISLSSSRSQVPAGSGFGVMADVKNTSQDAVFLRPKYFTMTPPPEIDPGTPNDWWAVIPAGPPPNKDDSYEKVIRLGPGDTTTAFWAGNPQPFVPNETWFQRQLEQLSTARSLIGFPPGEYTIRVVGIYWKDQKSAEEKSLNYRSTAANLKVLVVAPEWVILLGAVLGGMIAYLLLPKVRLRPHRFELFGFSTAALLSSIVTILLARLSETQFLVRVTINDFWGAIAIGFIASTSGTSILKKFISPPEPKRPAANDDRPEGERVV